VYPETLSKRPSINGTPLITMYGKALIIITAMKFPTTIKLASRVSCNPFALDLQINEPKSRRQIEKNIKNKKEKNSLKINEQIAQETLNSPMITRKIPK